MEENKKHPNEVQKTLRKLGRDFRSSLEFIQSPDTVRVIAVALAHDRSQNKDLLIPCGDGDPLNNEVYDLVKDAFHVTGVDFLDLGEIPLSFCVQMKDVYGWQVDIPLPSNVVRRFLTTEQAKNLKQWQAQYSRREYSIRYLQLKPDHDGHEGEDD
jgi:hypothetical protein